MCSTQPCAVRLQLDEHDKVITPHLEKNRRVPIIVLHFQGWLGAKDNIIHAGEGPIPIIRWAGTLVAWANNVCVRVSPTLHVSSTSSISRDDCM